MSPTRKLVHAALLFAAAFAYSGVPAKAFYQTCEEWRSSCYGGGGVFYFHECVPNKPKCGLFSCGTEQGPGEPSECCWGMPVGDCTPDPEL